MSEIRKYYLADLDTGSLSGAVDTIEDAVRQLEKEPKSTFILTPVTYTTKITDITNQKAQD